jgi:hypothetical protein
MAQRVLTEQLKQCTAKYTKKLALKFRKSDETDFCAKAETISSIRSIVEDPPKDIDSEPSAEENKKEDLFSTASGATAIFSGTPASLKRLVLERSARNIS